MWTVVYNEGSGSIVYACATKEKAINAACRSVEKGHAVVSVTPSPDLVDEKPISGEEIHKICAERERLCSAL